MHRVHGRAQHYAWGDPTSIPEMVGRACRRPAVGRVVDGHAPAGAIDARRRLAAGIGRRRAALPVEVHGCGAAAVAADPSRIGSRPRPVSSARNELGVPRDSPNRIYRDRFAKPEMLCALTTFDTLCGFRPVDDTVLVAARDRRPRSRPSFLQHEKLATTVAALYRGEFDPTSTIAACRRSRSCRSKAGHRARRDVSRRSVGRGDVVAEPGDAVGRRGRVPRARATCTPTSAGSASR